MALELPWQETEKLVQELAWRDYWQQIWIAKGDAINTDLNYPQSPVVSHQIPRAIINATTGIEAVDDAISMLYNTGYMHNHMRMYIASICCNIANCHWSEAAKWMYAHLFDGDLASNQLSWQWIAGSFSNKKYYANQDNINKFFDSTQKDTFLEIDYEAFNALQVPSILSEKMPYNIGLSLPEIKNPITIEDQPSLIYNYYNLDPNWREGEEFQRILLLEPSLFRKHFVSQKCIDFALDLKKNISGIKIFVGEFNELEKQLSSKNIIFKEHPLNAHYKGQELPREWLCSISGYFPSFFSFWKKCRKELLK